MKLKYRLKFAIDNVLQHGKQFLGSIVLMVLSLLLVSLLLMLKELHTNVGRDLEETLKAENDKVGCIIRNDMDMGDGSLILKMLELDSIEAAGVWEVYSLEDSGLNSLIDIQKNNVQEEINCDSDYLELIGMDASAWNMFDFSLYKGSVPEEISYDENLIPIYLGYAYRNAVEVGTILQSNIYDNNYVVAGIMEKNASIASSDEMQFINKFTLSISYPLDYAVIEIEPYRLDWCYFSVKDEYSFEDAEAEIQTLAKENNMSVTVKNIGALLRAAEESMKPVNKYLIQILLVVGMTTCMVITCFQTMTIIMQKSDYGIMYANGFSNTDLIVIVFMENVIKMVLALLILFPIMLLLSRSVFTSSYQDRYTIYTILFNNIGWKLILIGMGMTILSSIIPVATIKKYTPVELIGGAAS